MTGSNIKLVRLILYFLLLGGIVAGGFALLFDTNAGNDDSAWGMLGLVVGLLVKEGSAILSVNDVATIAAAVTPTTTMSAGPPATVTTTAATPPTGDPA